MCISLENFGELTRVEFECKNDYYFFVIKSFVVMFALLLRVWVCVLLGSLGFPN